MSDATMAVLARELAKVLITFAYERRDDDKKQIANLQHLLCVEYRNEQAEPSNENPPH